MKVKCCEYGAIRNPAAAVASCVGVVVCMANAGTPLDDPIPAPIVPGAVHVQLTTVATGLMAPNWAIDAPGHPGRLFVVDQPGILWQIKLDTNEMSVFLDLSSRLVPLGINGPGSYDERGFLGVAFHPDYMKNGRFYTYTSEPANQVADFSTIPPGDVPDHQNVVVEWTVPNPGGPGAAPDPASARVLFRSDHPQFNHDGGALQFGPDDMLYIAIGDGGNADDQGMGHAPEGNAQNLDTVLGKILRIDPLGTNSTNGQYGIPADNPFVGVAGLDEIFAYGFRNPFRMSFELTRMHELYVADVGQNDIEEMDVVEIGGNFGWRVKEGSFLFDPNGDGDGFVTADSPGFPANLVDPAAEYDHDEGEAIIGGFVYEGTKIPALAGQFVFGDLFQKTVNGGRLFHVDDDGGTIDEFNLINQSSLGLFLLGFGRDAHRELYVLANANMTPFGTTGVVIRIDPKLGDLNGDGHVDAADLAILLGDWGNRCGTDGCADDFSGNGFVGPADLAILLGEWTG